MLKIFCFLFYLSHALYAQVIWSPPVNISAPGDIVAVPAQVAVDSAGGNSVAVWQRSNGINTIIQAATKPFGGDWSTPVDLSAVGQDAQVPQVAIDPSGNAVAIWIRSNGVNFIVQAATKPFGGSWSTPVDLSAVGQTALEPQVVVDTAGNSVAIWQRSNGANTIAQAAIKPIGGDWSTPVDLSAIGQSAVFPQVAVDPAGNSIATWQRSGGINNIIQAATKTFGDGWSTPVNVSLPGQNAFNPQVAVDPAGNGIIIWQRFNGVNLIIQAAIKPFDLKGWSIPINLSASGQDAVFPQVAVDPGGNAIAVWIRFNGANFVIQAATKPFGGDWSTPIDLSTAGQNAELSQIAVDPGGNAVAVWQRFNGANLIIQAVAKPFGSNWSTPVDLSNVGQNGIFPQVAIDIGGNPIAVWVMEAGANDQVQASQGSFQK
ncbi:MAG: hypothetical protein L0207_02780 [Chlamydiae bacterium]|nr:hypothetical protein [Chlamydiota bacterium]